MGIPRRDVGVLFLTVLFSFSLNPVASRMLV